MHELSVTQGLLNTVMKSCGDAKKVNKVYMVMGAAHDYVPEIIQEYFTALAEETVASDAVIDFEITPVEIYCERCDKTYSEEHISTIRCIHCGSKDIQVKSGKELFIKSLEVDE